MLGLMLGLRRRYTVITVTQDFITIRDGFSSPFYTKIVSTIAAPTVPLPNFANTPTDTPIRSSGTTVATTASVSTPSVTEPPGSSRVTDPPATSGLPKPSDIASSSSLDAGSKAGIGVGVSLFVVLAILILIFRRRMLAFLKKRVEVVDAKPESKDPVHEIEDTSKIKGEPGTWTRAELDATPNPMPEVSELEASPWRNEERHGDL